MVLIIKLTLNSQNDPTDLKGQKLKYNLHYGLKTANYWSRIMFGFIFVLRFVYESHI